MALSSNSLELPSENPSFVRTDSKYNCQICKQVLRDAMQTSCGHRICEACVPKLFEGKEEPVMCPAGEEDCDCLTRSDILPDPSGRREIRSQKVHCDFKDLGCPEQPMWKDLADHKQICKFKAADCPNKSVGCEVRVLEINLKQHMEQECEYRRQKCQYCSKTVPLKLLEEHVQQECAVVQLPCPYNCGSQPMSRRELNIHKESCSSKPKECIFKSVGCQFKGTETEVAFHMEGNVTDHLEKVTLYTANMELQSMETRRELQEVTAERNQLRQQVGSLKLEVTTLKTSLEKVVKDNKDLKIKMVSLTERVIHLEKQSETSAKKDIVERHERDVRSMQTSLTQVRAQIVQLERQGEGRGPADNASAPELKRRIDMHDTQFAQLDVQLAELDLRFQILETASYDGTLMWKLRDYNRRKLDAVQGRTLSLYSQPFYTHRYGYKMCARIYLNGDGMGKGSHMSLFFVVMRGEYDNLLPWPFQQKVTMTLLDQETGQCNLSDSFRPDPTSTSFKKPTTDMNIASGCPLFVSHAVLETPKYVKDDTVMIKFHVDIQNLNHP